ncbi:ABC-2 transporter permease, partial [Clostridioides difficile]|nr:ABC-2 transporter permease [Clostridioides difficile]
IANTKYINLYSMTFLTIIIFIISMYFSIKISKKNKFNY